MTALRDELLAALDAADREAKGNPLVFAELYLTAVHGVFGRNLGTRKLFELVDRGREAFAPVPPPLCDWRKGCNHFAVTDRWNPERGLFLPTCPEHRRDAPPLDLKPLGTGRPR